MTVIFFCPNILRNAHRNIFQLERLIEDGYNVILLDATKYYGNNSTATDKLILSNRVECAALEDFYKFKEGLGEDPAIIVSFDQYMKFAAPILKLLVRKQDKVLSYHTKRFSNAHFPTNKIKILFDKIIRKADRFLPLHLFGAFYKWKYKIFIPDYYLCSTSYVLPSKAILTIKRDNRIIVHSDDINNVINLPGISNKQEKINTGVFLDQVLPFQDRLHPKLTPPIPKDYIRSYYENLEKTLKNLKESLGLDEIIIALHPDAVKLKDELSDKFQDFRTEIGTTNQLIRDSSIVFGHSSTALGFAVYFKKPVILLKDKSLMNEFGLIRRFMSFFEKALGFNSIYMDKPFSLPKYPFKIDHSKYNDYTSKFLKENSIQENSYYYAINYIRRDISNL